MNFLMVAYMMVNGKTIECMEKVATLIEKEIDGMVHNETLFCSIISSQYR